MGRLMWQPTGFMSARKREAGQPTKYPPPYESNNPSKTDLNIEKPFGILINMCIYIYTHM